MEERKVGERAKTETSKVFAFICKWRRLIFINLFYHTRRRVVEQYARQGMLSLWAGRSIRTEVGSPGPVYL